MKYKIGDKVRRYAKKCDTWWKECCAASNQKFDGVFTVSHILSGDIKLEGLSSVYSFDPNYFYLVAPVKSKTNSFEQEYEEARKLIGKTVRVSGTTLTYQVHNVIIRRDNDKAGISTSCNSFLKEHGYVVAVLGDGGLSRPFPQIEEVNDIIVILNSNYEAIVTKNTITVGRQTFSHDIVDKLKNAIEQINK